MATQNTSAFLYSILTYQMKSPLPLTGYQIVKNFPATPFLPTPHAYYVLKNFVPPQFIPTPSPPPKQIEEISVEIW